jgi:hypothetical protein
MTRLALSLLTIGVLAVPAFAEVPTQKTPPPAAAQKTPAAKADAHRLALAKKPTRHRRHTRARSTAPKTAPAAPAK